MFVQAYTPLFADESRVNGSKGGYASHHRHVGRHRIGPRAPAHAKDCAQRSEASKRADDIHPERLSRVERSAGGLWAVDDARG